MARGPEAKEMTGTCYVASSAWRCGGPWRGVYGERGVLESEGEVKTITRKEEKRRKELAHVLAGVWFACLLVGFEMKTNKLKDIYTSQPCLPSPSLPPPISTFGALHRPAINTCWIKWKTRSLHREDAVFSPGSLNRPQKCPRQDDSETTPFLHIK